MLCSFFLHDALFRYEQVSKEWDCVAAYFDSQGFIEDYFAENPFSFCEMIITSVEGPDAPVYFPSVRVRERVSRLITRSQATISQQFAEVTGRLCCAFSLFLFLFNAVEQQGLYSVLLVDTSLFLEGHLKFFS